MLPVSLFRRRNSDFKPLASVAEDAPPPTLEQLRDSAFFGKAVESFANYPQRSLMSDQSRALMFSLIRMRRPTYIAEIGTFRAGTTEVMARACWENNWGIIYTTDPFGGRRCPPIIRSWPRDLRKYVSFHPLTAMDFFGYLDQRRISLDLTLVDGNHDYEFALFDLQMAARRSRASALVVMDNAEQDGPFHAARSFLAANPAWKELGSAIASHDPSNPFDPARASFPDTSFIILQGPPFIPIGSGPHSWGQVVVPSSEAAGLSLDLARPAKGVLHYQVTLRAFFKADHPVELKAIGAAPIEASDARKLALPFVNSLQAPAGEKYTVEIDVSWEGQELLALAAPPSVM